MKVSELIRLLEQCDPEAEVVTEYDGLYYRTGKVSQGFCRPVTQGSRDALYFGAEGETPAVAIE